LARAVYRDADITIMDDVLAAVDVHVGEKLMTDCICGALAGKTRVLCTNQLHVLPRCDHIVVLDGGAIVQSGSYQELMADANGLLATLVATHEGQRDDPTATVDDPTPTEGEEEAGAKVPVVPAMTDVVAHGDAAKVASAGASKLVEVHRLHPDPPNWR
jgi:ABC-type multidrug transport system ATPase subunit